MEISQVYEIILAAAPAITAVIGIIVSLIAGVKRIKQSNKDTLEEVRNKNAEVIKNVAQIAQKNDELTRENAELKRDLRKVMAKLSHVHVEDDK